MAARRSSRASRIPSGTAGKVDRSPGAVPKGEPDFRDEPWPDRLRVSRTWENSVRSALRNFSRAGVAKKQVADLDTEWPAEKAAGLGALLRPPSISMTQALIRRRAGRLVTASRLTAPIDGRASPRKPSVRDVQEIVVGEFGRGRGVRLPSASSSGRHTAAVVLNRDECPAAVADDDVNP